MSEKNNFFLKFLKKMQILVASAVGSVFLNNSNVKYSKITSADYDIVIKKQGKKVFESPIKDMNTEFVLELEDEKIIINIHIKIEKKEKISKIKPRILGTPHRLGGSMTELEVKRQGRLLIAYIEDLKRKNNLFPPSLEESFPKLLKEEPEILVVELANKKTQEKKQGNPILDSKSKLKKE
jgi:hypothetical protein